MSKIITQTRFINEALEAHNKYRSLHGSPNLDIDPKLNEMALDWAEYLANNDTLKYRNGDYLDEPVGENVLRYNLLGTDLFYLSDEWYKEESNYNYDGQFSPNTGHFTQMVWKETKRVGFGFAITETGKFYVVANYYPAGNYKNHFLRNILRPFFSSKVEITKSDSLKSKIDISNNTDSTVQDSLSIRNHSENDALQIKFNHEALNVHNQIRSIHSVDPLELNHELSKLAQEHAEYLSKIQSLSHSSHLYQNKKVGENLVSVSDYNMNDLSGEEVTLHWYEESIKHDYNLDYQSKSGNFTQIVWKNTKEVGFGISKGSDGSFYAVAFYYPAGNVLGEFNQNIMPPLNV